MKLTIATLFAAVSVVGAFSTVNTRFHAATVAVRMSSEEETTPSPIEETPVVVEPPKPALPIMSESLPFMVRPPALDGTMVGDVGFDPLGFAKTKEDLLNYREAEIKHCRLAMLVSYESATSHHSTSRDKSGLNVCRVLPLLSSLYRPPPDGRYRNCLIVRLPT